MENLLDARAEIGPIKRPRPISSLFPDGFGRPDRPFLFRRIKAWILPRGRPRKGGGGKFLPALLARHVTGEPDVSSRRFSAF